MSNWTYSQDIVGSRPDPPPIPDDFEKIGQDKGHATKCRTFLNSVFRYNTTKRAELERTWNRYRLYDMGKQWLQPLRTTLTGQRLWFAWEPLKIRTGQSMFPRPVHNIFSPAMQDEVARLVKVGTKPYIKIDDREKEEGGLLAKQLLEDRNRKTAWVKQNRTGCYHMALFGQWVQLSAARVDFVKKTRGPALDAVMCENFQDGCEFTLATPDLTGDMAEHLSSRFAPSVQQMQPQLDDGETGFGGVPRAARCPSCGGNMVEADLPQSYYQNEGDAFGRPLYEDRASFEDITEVVSPYSFFPANQGIGYESASDMEEFGIRTPRSVPYLKRHYENAKDLKPEFDVQIMEHHPSVAGGWGLSPGQEGLWANHRLEDVYVLKPTYGFEQGMLLVMSGDRLLYHGPLNLEGSDSIPRVNVEVAQWEMRENEIWGKPLAEDMAPTQTVINSSLSQALDIQQKHSSPKMMLHDGMNLNFQGGVGSNFPGDVWSVNTRGIDPQIAAKYPHFFGNTGAPDSLFKIFEIAKEHTADASGARAAEIGNVSGVELNYSALLFSAQKSAERRGPRTFDIRELKLGTYKHRLRLIAWGYKTPYLMQFQTDRDEWQVREIRGFQLQDQTDVSFEEEPYVDSGVANRAAIQQAMSYGTIRTSANGGSYAADRRINREIGVPEALNEDRNIQQDRAHGEWIEYTENGDEPMVELSSDDHRIHLADHDLDLKGSEADKLKKSLTEFPLPTTGEAAGPDYRWTNILRITWTWEKMHGQLVAAQQAIETAPDPQKMLAIGMPPQQLMEIQQQLAGAQKMLGPDWPEALELQIENVWWRMIESAGLLPIDPLRTLVRFNAHRLAHWKLVATQAPLAGAPAGAAPTGPTPAAPMAAAPQSVDAAAAAA